MSKKEEEKEEEEWQGTVRIQIDVQTSDCQPTIRII